MRPGDWVIYYSPKESFGQDKKCQRFTAIGRVRDERVHSVEMAPGFVPHRRGVDFLPCSEASILLLIDTLSCIPDKKRWGAPFRFGILEIKQPDYERIARVMLPGAA